MTFPAKSSTSQWRLGQPATALEVANRTVTIGDERVEYETLIVATGTRARRWPGETGPNVFTLRDRDDAIALKTALNEAQSVAIVGAGFIGCEVASSARKLGLRRHPPRRGAASDSRRSARSSASAAPQLHRDHGVDAQARRARRPRRPATPT